MASSEITRNWGAIQIKSVDPYADVASDITSRLTKIIGTDNAYINGFDLLRYYTDLDYNGIIVQLSPGICVVSNIVIEITESTTVRLASFPIPMIDDYAIVVEYIYQKISPPPTAVIKGIRLQEVDERIHLPLYIFRLNGWTTFVSNEIFTTWMNTSKELLKDERNRTGYMPRVGGIVYGTLKVDRRANDTVADNELVTKEFVTNAIKTAIGIFDDEVDENVGILSRYVKKAGDVLTGPIYIHEEVPIQSDHQIVHKKYVDNIALNKNGDIMIGKLLLSSNPTEPTQAATKDYVDKSAERAAANMQIAMKHGDLSQLDSDQHKQYMLVSGNRGNVGFTAPVSGKTPIVNEHLTTKEYVDNLNKTMNRRMDNLVINNNTINHSQLIGSSKGDDHTQYMLVNGQRAFAGPVSGIYPVYNSHLSTKQYVDDVGNNLRETLSSQMNNMQNSLMNLISNIENGTNVTINLDDLYISHNKLKNLGSDDHKQYLLVNGSRAVSGPLTVSTPINDSHAVTKKYMTDYVDSAISTHMNLPTGVSYMKSDGTVPFIAAIEGVAGNTPNSLATLQQLQTAINESVSIKDHNNLTNRDADDAHPQYALLSGAEMTGALKVLPAVTDDEPVTYFQYKQLKNNVNVFACWKYDTTENGIHD